ncbi:FdhF/YdeP family oxidoreductase [uncultured Paraglaciecola sp.]|uniref:FdhF/YdeP family oxidoreductase n=1 Tax=uncultured Paraglaciecola sp. TaxID=1765024 RepID=UPI0025EFBFE9|nr:FdhF/YdeP family oxidoreductase [uncultured Paraglaciecola sp.]
MTNNNSNKSSHHKPAKAGGFSSLKSTLKHIIKSQQPQTNLKNLLIANTKDGFDCPGCAWGDKQEGFLHFCENGAKAIAWESTSKKVDAKFFAEHTVSQLLKQSDYWLEYQGRLTQPVRYNQKTDKYEAVSWDDAFSLIAEHLNGLSSPDQAEFYTSGRASNEASFLYQLFGRLYGTNNFPDCSNMCHEASGVALTESIGIGKGTVVLDDFDHADAIFVFGQNPGSNHPRMLSSLQAAKRQGAKIVSINPLDETGLKRFKNPQEVEGVIGSGTALRDLYLPIKINGDVPFLKGLCKALIERDDAGQDVLDKSFIAKYCHGYDEFQQNITGTSWAEIEQGSGLSQKQINQAADIACASKKTICCWAMGMTQHKNAVANIQLMTNFLMLQGNLGKPGAGVCPVRGHSNVQGDRTMGIWEKPSATFLNALQQTYDFIVPREHGFDTLESIQAMAQGKVKVLFALGGNFYRATPDHTATKQALANCDLTVQVSTKLNQSHLYTGKNGLILPALGRTEIDQQATGIQTVTVENSMGVVQTSHGKIPPASNLLKSEVAIVSDLATLTLPKSEINWQQMRDDYRLIRDGIAKVIPGFENFNQRIEELGEFELPNAVRDDRKFVTSTGKANFVVHDIESIHVPKGCLLMMTIRSHDQFNTTVYTDNDRYRGIHGSRRVVFVNADDLNDLALRNGQLVDIHSHWPNEQIKIRMIEDFILVEYDIPCGCAAAYYPETNDLIPLSSVADKSNTPAYKSVVISLHKADKDD